MQENRRKTFKHDKIISPISNLLDSLARRVKSAMGLELLSDVL